MDHLASMTTAETADKHRSPLHVFHLSREAEAISPPGPIARLVTCARNATEDLARWLLDQHCSNFANSMHAHGHKIHNKLNQPGICDLTKSECTRRLLDPRVSLSCHVSL